MSHTLSDITSSTSKKLNVTSYSANINLVRLHGALSIGLIVKIVQNAIDSLLEKIVVGNNIKQNLDEIPFILLHCPGIEPVIFNIFLIHFHLFISTYYTLGQMVITNDKLNLVSY